MKTTQKPVRFLRKLKYCKKSSIFYIQSSITLFTFSKQSSEPIKPCFSFPAGLGNSINCQTHQNLGWEAIKSPLSTGNNNADELNQGKKTIKKIAKTTKGQETFNVFVKTNDDNGEPTPSICETNGVMPTFPVGAVLWSGAAAFGQVATFCSKVSWLPEYTG